MAHLAYVLCCSCLSCWYGLSRLILLPILSVDRIQCYLLFNYLVIFLKLLGLCLVWFVCLLCFFSNTSCLLHFFTVTNCLCSDVYVCLSLYPAGSLCRHLQLEDRGHSNTLFICTSFAYLTMLMIISCYTGLMIIYVDL